MSSHRVPPPGVASSVSRGSFRDTRVANDFSPFGVDDFNSANPATKQMAQSSPFLHGVRPGSLHTNGTPMHRQGGAPALSRRDSMESFYADATMHSRGRPPHPDDVFSDHGSQYHDQATPYVPNNKFGSGHDSQIGMSVHGATPQGQHGHLHPDDNSVRYGSLYGEPYQPQRQSLHPQDIPHKQSFQTNGSKLSRSTKLTKKSGLSGFSLRRKPKQPAMSEEGSEFNGTPYIGRGHNTASIISERGNVHQTPKPSRSPSILSQHQEILHGHAHARSQSLLSAQPSNMVQPESIMVHEPPGGSMRQHRRGGSTYGHEPPDTRPISMRDSIRSIHKAPPGTFPFEREGDDIIAQVWLPWTERLQERPCHFHVDGMHGERYWLEVDYRFTKAINGTVKFHGGGIQHSGSYGRGRFIVEWEIGFQFEPEISKGASDGLFRNSVSA